MSEFIPVNEPLLDGNELAYLTECITGGWISSEGSFVAEFERTCAKRFGRRHAIAVTSGSTALELAVEALGLAPGDEVVVPDFTIISCLAPLVRRGIVPVVVDADPVTWTMDVNRLEAALTPRTRAVMAVHIYGLPVDMQPLLHVARTHGLKVIEDAAEAHGLTYRGAPCGSFGDVSVLSFYANKHVTTGEGGMLLVDDEATAQHLRSLRNLCFKAERRFVHDELGYNYRMTNLQAALGLAQVEMLDEHLARKHAIGARYRDRLADCTDISLAPACTDYAENGYWVFGLVLEDHVGADAATIAELLARRGVGTRPFFFPMHLQPVFVRAGLFEGVECPVSARLGERGLYLPSGLAVTDEQIDRAADALLESLAEVR